MTEQEKLEYLITEFENKNYTIRDFCDLFIAIYCEVKTSELAIDKRKKYGKILEIVQRYSPYRRDTENFGDYFINDKTFMKLYDELKQ